MTRTRVMIGTVPTRVVVEGEQRSLGPAETAVVAALALFHPAAVGVALLREVLWGGEPPTTAGASLQNHLSRIRRRAPGLVDRDPDGYRLAPEVAVEVEVGAATDVVAGASDQDSAPALSPVPICPELAGSDAVEQRRSELARQLRAADESRLGRRLTADDPASTLPELHDAVERDAFDERAWFRLVAATAAALGRDAALSVSDGATRTLATSGLEPGRRLRDLARLVRDGERDLERLMTDRSRATPPDGSTAVDAAAMDARANEVLALLDENHATHVRIHGPQRSGRSALLDLIVVRANRAGVSARTVVGFDFDGLPLPVGGEWIPQRRRLLAIDDLDRLGDASRDSLAGLASAAAVEAATNRNALVIVSTAADPVPLPGRGTDALATVDVELDRAVDRGVGSASGPTSGSLLAELSVAERSVLQVLAVSEIPIHLSDLDDLVPGAAALVAAMPTAGWLRDRHDDGRWSIVDGDLRSAVLADLSSPDALEMHRRLATARFVGDAPDVRARRVARHAVAAVQLDRPGAVAALERAAEQALGSFDHHAAASLFTRAAAEARPLDPARSLSDDLAAGRALLATGDVAGLDRLEAVVDRSLELGLEAPAAAATHAFCRLGPASTAGEVDERAARLIEQVLPRLSEPADRALVGGSATMVHVFAGGAQRCGQLFDQALESAEESGRDDVLAEVLPFAYLSRAAPEDLDLRERLADRLAQVAERLDRPDTRWEALHLRFSNQLQRGDPGFRASADLLATAADGSRDVVREWEMAYVRATVAHVDGRLVGAEEEIEASLAVSGAVGANRAMAVYGAVVLACRFDQGRVEELAPSIEAIAAEQPLILAWQAPLALASAVTGASDRAAEAFDRLVGGADLLPRDCSYTAALVMLGEAAARLGDPARTARAVDLLAPWSGRWAWTGTCTFGPIDLTLARLAESRGDRASARALGTAALRSAAAMRAPVVADRAGRLVLRQT